MSSSRSDDVNKCVCICVGVILFSLEHSKHLKHKVLRELQCCLKKFEVSRVFKGCIKGVSRKFQVCFKETLKGV